MASEVSWNDYAGGQSGGPFAGATNADIMALNKALVAGQGTAQFGSAIPGDGSALRVESLESTLKNTTFSMKEIALWKALPKLAARSTVEQYNELQSYGQNMDAGFIPEGDAPNPDDSVYIRRDAVVKYMGTQRAVTYQMSLVEDAHGDAIGNETVAGTMWLLRMVERAILYADSTLSPIQYDGYIPQILRRSPASNIIDMHGAPLDSDVLSDGIVTVSDQPNYGSPTHLACTPKVRGDLVKSFLPQGRYDLLNAPTDGRLGADLKGISASSFDVDFLNVPFITDGGAPSAAMGGAAAPLAPTVSTAVAAGAPAGGVTSFFRASDAGNYWIKVQACNRYGRSAAVVVTSSALAVTTGQAITFGVTPAVNSAPVEWYETFMTPVGSAQGMERRVARTPNTDPNTQIASTAAATITLTNSTMPGTTHAILFQMNKEAVAVKQLCPMVKIPFGITDAKIRWAQYLFHVPILYTPGKILLFKNVGRSLGSVGNLV